MIIFTVRSDRGDAVREDILEKHHQMLDEY